MRTMLHFHPLSGGGRASAGPEGRDGPVREKQDTPLHLDHVARNRQLPQQHQRE